MPFTSPNVSCRFSSLHADGDYNGGQEDENSRRLVDRPGRYRRYQHYSDNCPHQHELAIERDLRSVTYFTAEIPFSRARSASVRTVSSVFISGEVLPSITAMSAITLRSRRSARFARPGCRPFLPLLLQSQLFRRFRPLGHPTFPLGHPDFSTGPPRLFHWATQGFAWATQGFSDHPITRFRHPRGLGFVPLCRPPVPPMSPPRPSLSRGVSPPVPGDTGGLTAVGRKIRISDHARSRCDSVRSRRSLARSAPS